jgi:hypothetical protein
MLIAITTIKSAIVRKAMGLLVPKLRISPSALQARPFSTKSQDLPSLELKMPDAIAKAPAASVR